MISIAEKNFFSSSFIYGNLVRYERKGANYGFCNKD